MPKLPDDWSTFKRAVEGQVTPSSCVIKGGLPVFNSDPDVQKPPKSNLLVLAQVLRGNQPIPQDIRNWLADMMDPEAESSFKFQLKKNGRGPKRSVINRNWDAAIYVSECIRNGVTRKQALGNAETKFGLKRSSIEAAIVNYEAAIEENDRVTREECWPSEDEER
jgi:hypothetical protein